ncbi:MAG: hypothetical protein U5R06_24730 [candidate division KSB1 bacterium]|nr:hypothetical protein [candidate division KSB1 bacterium]
MRRDKSIINGQKTDVQGRIGHEGAGIVVRRDAGIQYLETEQPVVILPFINKHSIGYDWPEGGKGIFSNYPVIPGNAVYPIQKDMISPYDEFLHIL